MDIKVVIGANYGDEGKGLVTEWLCRNVINPIVVLNNGGPQRGHTIEHKDGKRHVFHHFGSGTLIGAPTYFTSNYYVNPQLFVEEYHKLLALGCEPKTYCDPNCKVILPVYVAINQMLESTRGKARHGSVGQGLWEAVVHNGLRLIDFMKMSRLERRNYMNWVNSVYPILRFEQIKKEEHIELKTDNDIFQLLTSNGYTEHWLDDLEIMCSLITGFEPIFAFKNNTLIFENGQGLLLDESKGIHTTPSKTGLNGVLDYIKNFNFGTTNIEAYYVSRTYITRHGAGDFPEQDDTIEHFEDLTNQPNDWQGSLRYGKLDINELLYRVDDDACGYPYKLVMTHVNELPNTVIEANFISNTKYSDDVKLNS